MDFREYLRIALVNRKLIAYVTGVAFLVALAGSLLIDPQYSAKTTVVIKSALNQPRITLSSGSGSVGDSQNGIQLMGETYREILRSRTIAEKIVAELHLDDAAAAGRTSRRGIGKTVGMIKRKTIKFLRYGTFKTLPPHDQLIQGIQDAITTSLLPKTGLIEIKAVYEDADTAAKVANSAARNFVEHMKDMNSAEARVAKEFIQERVKVAEGLLKQAQDELKTFIVKQGSIYPERKVELVMAELVKFDSATKNTSSEIDQLRVHVAGLRQKLAQYSGQLATAEVTFSDPVVQDLRKQVLSLEIEKASLAPDFGPLHPRMVAMERKLVTTRAELDRQVKKLAGAEMSNVSPHYDELVTELLAKETALNVAIEKKKALEAILTSYPPDLMFSAEKQVEWETLQNAVKFAQSNLDSLKTQLEGARITEAQKLSETSIVDPAVASPFPSGIPKSVYPLLGLIVGLMGAIGVAFFIEHIDDTLKTVEMVESVLQLPVYAVIPTIRPGDRKRERRGRSGERDDAATAGMMEKRLLTHFEPRSVVAEAYRSLRTNIQFAGIQEKSRVFLVTSSVKGEGKSTTAANLSITMAQLGSRVLLIDADMRSPMLGLVFGKRREPGLSNYLGAGAELSDVIQPSGIPGLDLICGGAIPPNPSELISAGRVPELLQQAKASYDVIVVDSPPVIAVTDAAILSSFVHGVFMVVHARQTSRRLCQRAKALLQKVNARLLGIVMNNVDVESRYGYEYYAQHYYDGDKIDK